jgi:hypothetical protein
MPATPPPMQTKDEFVNATTPTEIEMRGRASLVLIDGAMEAWDTVRTGGTAAAKGTALAAVMEMCKEFLGRGVHSRADMARLRAVTELAQQAFACYAFWQFEHNRSRRPPRPVKKLSGDYQVERDAYKASKAAGRPVAPPSMSSIHFLAPVLGDWEGRDLFTLEKSIFGRAKPTRAVRELTDQYIQRTTSEGVKMWTAPEIRWTPQNARAVLDALTPDTAAMAPRRVNFLSRAGRSRFMLYWDGRHFYREFGVPYTTGTRATAYAIDAYGNIYAANEDEMRHHNPEGTRFNHSSLNAGKGVISAGIIVVDAGRLVAIDNLSGHYKPTMDNLHNGVCLLHEMRVPLEGVCVDVGFRTAAAWVRDPATGVVSNKTIEGTWRYDGARFAANQATLPTSVTEINKVYEVVSAPAPAPPVVAPPPPADPVPDAPVADVHRVVFHDRRTRPRR